MSEDNNVDNTGSNRLRKYFEEDKSEDPCPDCEPLSSAKLFTALDYQHQTYGTDAFDLEELANRINADAEVIGRSVFKRDLAPFELEFLSDLFLGMAGHAISFNDQGEQGPDWYYRAVRAGYDLVKSPPSTFRDEFDRMKGFMHRAYGASEDDDRQKMAWLHRHLDMYLLAGAGLISDNYVRDEVGQLIRTRLLQIASKGLRQEARRFDVKLTRMAVTFLSEAVLSIADLPTYDLDEMFFRLSQVYDPEDSALELAWNQVRAVRDLRNVVLAPSSEFGGACDLFRESAAKNFYLSKKQLVGMCSSLGEQAKVARSYLGIEPAKGPDFVPPALVLADPRYLPDLLNE